MIKKLKIFEPDENFYKNHVTFTSIQDIHAITLPLQKIGISYFTFDRTYKDNSHIRLTNNGKWIEYYYRKQLYDVALFEKDPKLFTDGFVFWSWLKREPVYLAASEHDIDHGMTITQTHDLYCDFFHFGTTCKNFISPESMITEIKNLYRFINYFKEKAQHRINEAEQSRFILPLKSQTRIHLADVKYQDFSYDIFKGTEVARLYLGEEFDNIYLTRKEIEILGFLKNGMKPVEIAQQSNLSERTVETHIKNIKEKFKCATLFELGFVTGKLSVQHIFPFSIDVADSSGDHHGTLVRYN